jgi:hypothetical protein
MKDRVRNIVPLIIRGGAEFSRAFGVCEKKQAEMRDQGMPAYHNGKCFVYFLEDVEAWIKENWQINLPEIPDVPASCTGIKKNKKSRGRYLI